MQKIGLVLEGGAMRGMYTAGVLDVFLDNNIPVDGIIGVSAGALFGVNYYSKQKGRVIRYSKRFCKDLRYISIPSLLLTGNIVNKNFAYYKVSKKYDKFDDKEFVKNNKEYYAVVTNIENGEGEYLKINSCTSDMEKLRASSAIPLYTLPVQIGNKKYLDGAIADSIPFLKMKELGFDKIIVILTRPKDYRKEELSEHDIKKVFRKYNKYPKLIDSIKSRPRRYNEMLDKVNDYEEKGDIFVIRPSEKIDVKVIERDSKKLQKVYDLGIKDANNCVEKLKHFIKCK